MQRQNYVTCTRVRFAHFHPRLDMPLSYFGHYPKFHSECQTKRSSSRPNYAFAVIAIWKFHIESIHSLISDRLLQNTSKGYVPNPDYTTPFLQRLSSPSFSVMFEPPERRSPTPPAWLHAIAIVQGISLMRIITP